MLNWLFAFLFSSSALAFVQVNPVRFHIKDAKLGHFTVRNTQSKSVSVEIENKYFAMKPDGSMGEGSGDDELRKILFTPKNFVLKPGEKQVVRFFVKDDLKVKELRTFAYILTEIQNKADEKGQNNSPAQVLNLTPKVAIAIPVVYRPVTDPKNALIQNEKFEQDGADCIMTSNWSNGTHSSYVNLEVFGSSEKPVFAANGVSNYLKSYDWKQILKDVKCSDIKKIQIFDVDNEVLVVNREVKL